MVATKAVVPQRLEPVVVPQQGRPWTIADLYALAGDENRYELVRGELLQMSPASPVQGRFASRLDRALATHVDEHDLGEVYVSEPGFILMSEPDVVVRAPDVAFVRKERVPPADDEEGFWEVAPDLAVEIISPSETADSVLAKVQDYLAAGTPLIWLVYPRKRLVIEYRSASAIRHLGSDDTLEGGAIIPGFAYPLRQLFRDA